MENQLLEIEELIADALRAGVTLYEKQGALAFKQSNGFPSELKARIIEHKAAIIRYFQQQQSVVTLQSNMDVIAIAERDRCLPLSFAQQGLWFIEQLQGSQQYYMPAEFTLKGHIDVPLLRAAIKHIVGRHEILRSQFITDPQGIPYVQVTDTFVTPFQWLDASTFPVTQRQSQIKAALIQHQAQPFDLSRDVLIRVLLVSDNEQHYLAFNMHHIVSDGASMQIFAQELQTIYTQLLQGNVELDSLPIQYADYAAWQRNTLTAEYFTAAINYWRTTLGDLEPLQSLPTDKVRSSVQKQSGLVYRQRLSRSLVEKIQQHAASQSVTPFMWLLSSFMLFIGRIKQTEQVLIGTPTQGREHPQLNDLIGLFVNTLVMHAVLPDELTFNAWLQQQKERILQSFEYRNMPFDKLVEGLNCQRDLSHHPLVQIFFTLTVDEQPTFQLPGVEIAEARSEAREHHSAVKCDLELNAVIDNQGLTVTWKFDEALYELATITHWADSFAVLLANIVAAPDTQISKLALLDEQQLQALTDAATSQQADSTSWDQSASIVSVFEQQAIRFADQLALVDEHEALTYKQLNERANLLARVLLSQGVEAQDMLPVSVTRNVNLVVTLLAVLKAGAAYVPIDPNYPRDRISYIVDDVQSNLVLCDNSSLGLFSQHNLTCINIDDCAIYTAINQISDTQNLELAICPSHLAYMIYTSGTTGRPKGVQIEHRQVIRLLCVQPSLFDFNEHDVWTLFHSFCFDFSVWEMYGALLFGGRLVIVDADTAKDSDAFANLLLDQHVSVLNQTPSAFYALQTVMLTKPSQRIQQSKIRYVIFGGEALQPVKLTPWAKRFSDCQLINMYGITETTVHVTFKRLHDADLVSGANNIGRPIPTTSCYVLDKFRQLLPVGAVGELYVGGDGVCRGYWRRDELNVERFVADTFSSANAAKKLYKTGDLVRQLATGELSYMGRIDDQVKVRGYRIELGEIENQLRGHPKLSSATVLLNTQQPTNPRITAFVIVKSDAVFAALTSEVQQFLRTTLPEFMLPTNVIAVLQMPLTVNGKIDKKALLALDQLQLKATADEPPGSDDEQAIAAAFEAILKVSNVGRQGHFFELGGHSLLASQLVSHLAQHAQLSITLADLFYAPQVHTLALAAARNKAANYTVASAVIPKVQSVTQLPVSFAQQRLWTIDQLQPGNVQYHMPANFELHGLLDVDTFQRVCDAIVQRHEVLRTFITVGKANLPQQVVQDTFPSVLKIIDASELNDEQQQRLWLKTLRDDSQAAFDLRCQLPLRIILVKLHAKHWKLRVNMHHIASDAHSLAILASEFEAFYQSFTSQTRLPEQLAQPLSIQYGDYAHWQRSQLHQQQLDKHQAFWLQQLQDAPPIHQIPLDKIRPKQLTSAGASYQIQLDKTTVSAIHRQCQQFDVSLFMWLHSAYAAFVARYSQCDDVVIGAPFSGRSQTQLTPLIGFFINTLPIRCQLREDMCFEGLLAQQKQLIVAVGQHQAMPFEKIVDALQLPPSMSQQSVFQLTFSLNPRLNTQFKLPNIQVTAIDEQPPQVKFDIELACSEDDDELRFSWAYNTALFTPQTIQTMATALCTLIRSFTADPQVAIQSATMLTDKQLHNCVLKGEQRLNKPVATVIDAFTAVAEQHAKTDTGIIEAASGQFASYQQIHQRSELLAKYLIQQGLQAEQPVVVSMQSGIDLIVSLLAIMRAGGCYVPVDPNYPASRIAYIINDCGAQWLITHTAFAALLEDNCGANSQLIYLDNEQFKYTLNLAYNTLSQVQLPKIEAAQLAYVIYTSGTTGNPKGVMIPHQGLSNLCRWHQRAFAVDKSSIASQTANIAFDAASWEIWPYLSAGAKLVIVPRESLDNPQKLAQLLDEHHVSHCFLATPIAEIMLADHAFTPVTLRYLLVGGDKLKTCPSAAKPYCIINNYGPTETSVVATSAEVGKTTEELGMAPDIGYAIDNVELLIVDQQGQPVVSGMIGELYIAGAGLARGYLNRPELTAQRFIYLTTVAEQQLRAYKTGDLVRQLNNGRIAYIGRNDAQVKLRGYRIELSEIEYHLRAIAGVTDCVVSVSELAEGHKQLLAFIVTPQISDSLQAQFKRQSIASLKVKLPDHMIPSELIHVDEIPLTAHGKIDHLQLHKHLRTPSEQIVTQQLNQGPAAQQASGLSSLLLTLYRQVLNQPMLQVDDDFFAAGGDSILSIQIASRARAQNISLSVADIFNFSTVAVLAEQLVHKQPQRKQVEPQQSFSGALPLLPIQHWFFEQQFVAADHWNQSLLLSVDKTVTVQHIKELTCALLAHHDSLRLVVDDKGLQKQFFIKQHLSADHVCHFIDLAEHNDDWSQALEKVCEVQQGAFRFDGTALLQICHIKTPAQQSDNRLLIIAHHLLIDGVSWRILLEDINQALSAAKLQQNICFASRTANLYDISQFLIAQGKDEYDLKHWQALVAVATKPSFFRFVRQQEPIKKQLQQHTLTLPCAATQQLLTTANRPYNTSIQTLLLAALQWSAVRHYDLDDHLIVLEGHGRELLNNQLDSTRTLGWLTAMYPFRLFSNTQNIADLICDMKEQLANLSTKASRYGALRYYHPDEKTRQSLTITTENHLFFNYLGQLDSALQHNGLLDDAPESAGSLHSQHNHAYYGLQLTAAIVNEQLSMHVEYDGARIAEADVASLMTHYQASIMTVLEHCIQDDIKRHTVSDFPLLPTMANHQLQHLLAPFKQSAIVDIYPLSALQEGMCFHSQRTGEVSQHSAYYEQTTLLLEGAFDIEAFEYAWHQLLDTHSILRTAFVASPVGPVQIVVDKYHVPLQVELVTEAIMQQQQQSILDEQAYITAIADQEYQQGIDLAAAPCMRLRLLALSDTKMAFIWTYHHLIMDGWSLPVLFSELLQHYQARLAGHGLSLKKDNYSDYIKYLQQQDKTTEQQFWQGYLANIDQATLLVEHIAQRKQGDDINTVSEQTLVLEPELGSQLVEFARQQGLTVNHLLQGAWGYWLSVCCNSDYALFGQTVSGRPSQLTNVEQRVGLYINTQAVLLTTSGEQSVLAYLKSVKQSLLAVSDYAHTPLTQVHNYSNIANGSPLFDALYVFENFPTDPLAEIANMPFKVLANDSKDLTHYPMTLVVGQAEQLSLTLSYQSALFNDPLASHCLAMLQQLLQSFVMAPEQPLSSLAIDLVDHRFTTGIDKVAEFSLSANQVADVSWDIATTLQQRFTQIVASYGESTALKYYNDDNNLPVKTMSYNELDAAANRLANYLLTHTLGSDRALTIGICLSPGCDLIVAILASLKIGAAYVPIAPSLPLKRRQFMAADAELAVLLTCEQDWQGALPPTLNIDLHTCAAALALQPNYSPTVTYTPHDLCYVIYTSGTTGVPKGVMVEQHSVINYVQCLQKNYAITSQDNYLQFASCSFDVFAEEVFCTLLSGATLVMADQQKLLDTQYLAKLSQYSQLTLMSLPTAYWHQLAAAPVTLADQLRIITIGGEQMQAAMLQQWQAYYSDNIILINAYGPTEATISATLIEVTDYTGSEVPIGQPVAGLQLHILDKYLRAVPYYVSGQLYLSGKGLARGYLNDVKKTAAAFIIEPKIGVRLYKTGDKVRCTNTQEVMFLGRLDEQVKIRGYRVELPEIERHLLALPQINACAVVVRKDKSGNEQLVAFVDVGELERASEQLIRALVGVLPEYMVPQNVQFVDSLPCTNNGKIDRKQLSKTAQQLSSRNDFSYSAPITPLHKLLVEQFSQLLNIEQVGINDDFFMLGGHSLLAMRLVSKLSYQMQLTVSIDMLFRHRTVNALAEAIEQLQKSHAADFQPTTLVCLQAGEQGFQPVILVAGAGGLLMIYQALVNQLDQRIPVYGLQPDLIALEPDIINSLSLTAHHYCNALIEQGIDANIHLVGHSFGSFVIHQMAQQLVLRNKAPASLLVIDTPMPNSAVLELQDRQIAALLIANLSEFFQLNLTDDEQQLYCTLADEQQTKWLSKHLAAAGYQFSARQLLTLQCVYKAQLQAKVEINRELLEVPLMVIKAHDTKEFAGQLLADDMGWRVVNPELSAIEITGNHLSILQHQFVAAIVEQIASKYTLY